MLESRQPVCGARGGSQPRTGASCRFGSEPVASNAATVNRGDGVVDTRRGGGAGDRGSATGCAEPMAFPWPSGSQRGCACLLGSSDLDSVKRVAVWDDSGAARVAEQSVAGNEERTGGFNAPAPFSPAGSVVRRTNCNLHTAGNGLPRRGARHGAHAAHSTRLPATARNAGRDGPKRSGRRRAA